MIKAVIFDFGNVIAKFDNKKMAKNLSKYTNKSTDEIFDLIFSSGLPEEYETGKIYSDIFFKKIVDLCNLDIEKKEFITAYTNRFTTIKSTINLIKRLKTKYKLGLLSNTSEWDFEYGTKPIINNLNFDEITLSYEVGDFKDNKKMFETILNKLKLKPDECVYIDDIKEYSDKATKLGMHGITYTSYENLIKELKKINVKV